MKCVCVLVVLLSIAFAGNCGTYQSECQNDPFGRSSSQTVLKIQCGMNGFVSKSTMTIVQYDRKSCEGGKLLTSVYSMKMTPEATTNKTDATYSVATKKVTVRSENVTRLTEGYKCTTEMKNKKTYDLNKFTCTYEGMELDLFLVQRTFLQRSFNSRFVFGKNALEVKSGLLMGDYTRTSSWGCLGWTIFFVVLGVVVVAAIAAVVLMYVFKPSSTLKTKLTK